MTRLVPGLPPSNPKPEALGRPRSSTARTRLVALLLGIGLALGCSSGLDARLAEAYRLQEAGNLAASIEVLRELIADEPNQPEANFLLGSALIQNDQQWLAVAPLEIALADDDFAIPAGLLLASTQFRTQKYEDAIRAASRVLEFDPTNLTARFTRGRSLLATSRPEPALEDANQILALKPDAQNALVLKASALVRLDRRDEAEALWQKLRDETAASGNENQAARACAQLAIFYVNHDENETADETFTQCLDAYPTNVFLQTHASQYYVRQGRPERAIEIHRVALEAAPDDLRSWNRLARTLYDHVGAEAAEAKLDEAAEHFDSPAAWRLLASFHRRERHAAQARQAIEEAIQRSPEPPETFVYSLAELLVEEGNLQRAREVGQRLRDPSYQHLLAGAILQKSGDPEGALQELDIGLALWPDNAHSHFIAGQASLQLRDRRRAVQEFMEAINSGGDLTDAGLELAEIYFSRGQYPLAYRLAAFQIKNRPYLDPTPYHIAIRSQLELGRIEDAIGLAEDLARVDPEAPAAVVEMAAIQRVQHGPEAAVRYVRSAGRDLADPKNEPILRSLSNDLNSLGRAEEALRLIDLAIARDDSAAPLHDLRARLLSHLGRNAEAEKSTNRALEIDPSFAPALEMKAFVALEAGDDAMALAALDAATRAAPENSNYPYSAATVARKIGDVAGEKARLEETLARQPIFGPAANDLAWLLATDRLDLERALRLAQIAARQNRSTNTLTTLGWVRHQRGEYDDAIRNYRSVLEEDANLPTVRYRLGLSLSEAGHKSEAVDLFDDLVTGPDFPEIDEARAELARIKGS